MEYLLILITFVGLLLIFIIIPCVIVTNETVPTDSSVNEPLTTQRIVEEGVPVLSVPSSEIMTLLILFYIYAIKKEDFFTSKEATEYICNFTKNQLKNNEFYYRYYSSRPYGIKLQVINILKQLQKENIINSQALNFKGENHMVYWLDTNTSEASISPTRIIEDVNDLTKKISNRELVIQIING